MNLAAGVEKYVSVELELLISIAVIYETFIQFNVINLKINRNT
jgi:hypothetical protein